MSVNREHVQSIFGRALDIESAEERVKYLDEACSDADELRAEVESLLNAVAHAGNFLGGSAAEMAATVDQPAAVLDQPIAERVGTQIGPYKLLEVIGEGGMGVVYMAEQKEPVKRRVALKIIKPGMDTQQVIARFEAERQALAIMDHPNIARVLDAGATTSGRPYFVMELVQGVPFTEYCDQRHLTPEQRLKLFLPICEAVQHAHQKGIIHRDLKPSNVLVTRYDERPVPKVIDFGIAKAMGQRLTDKTMFTQFGQVVGTLEYMSPEQAEPNQLDVDTRSDVYSLGVLLYELLTGTTPHDRKRLRSAAFAEMLRIIREEEPLRPSMRLSTIDTLPSVAANRNVEPHKLSTLMRGELDWIVMKAMEKDRTRRYETANGFAADIRRYLDDEPVVACPPSAAYRFRKFARRNKGLLATAIVVATALLLGLVGTSWQWRRAETARQYAANEAELRRRQLYASDIVAAQQFWGDHNVSRVLYLLKRSIPTRADQEDLRNFEWYYLWRLCRPSLMSPTLQHESAVRSVAFTPDGRYLASGSEGRLSLWDVATAEQVHALEVQGWSGFGLAVSPDGKTLATGSFLGTIPVRLWRLLEGSQPAVFHQPIDLNPDELLRVSEVAFSPECRLLAASSHEGDVLLWDLDTQEQSKLPGHEASTGAYDVAFSREGTLASAGGNDHTVKLWDVRNGVELQTLQEHENQLMKIAFSPHGETLACGHRDGRIALWNVPDRQLQTLLEGHTGCVSRVAFSPADGNLLASSSWDGTVKLWDVQEEKNVHTLKGHSKALWEVAFSPDGKTLASASGDGTVKLWNLSLAAERDTLGRSNDEFPGSEVWFSADGRTLVSRTKSPSPGLVLKVWDLATGKQTDTFPIFGLGALSPDGKTLASRREVTGPAGSSPTWTLEVQRLDTGQKQSLPHTSFLEVVFSPQGETLAVVEFPAAELTLWDLATYPYQRLADLKVYKTPTGHPVLPAFSPDGATFATTNHDPTETDKPWYITLWDLRGNELSRIAHSGHHITALAFSADGRFIAEAHQGRVQIWDVKTGEPQLTANPLRRHRFFIDALAFSPDGTRLASGGQEGIVRLWDTSTGKQAITLRGHENREIASLAFSPNGKTLASIDKYNTVKLWRAATADELRAADW